MSFTNKIDEWMKEAEERPESAVMIVRLIARRLRELSERDQELLAENIALQNGTGVEEYQKRIANKFVFWRFVAAILIAIQIKNSLIIFQIRL